MYRSRATRCNDKVKSKVMQQFKFGPAPVDDLFAGEQISPNMIKLQFLDLC